MDIKDFYQMDWLLADLAVDPQQVVNRPAWSQPRCPGRNPGADPFYSKEQKRTTVMWWVLRLCLGTLLIIVETIPRGSGWTIDWKLDHLIVAKPARFVWQTFDIIDYAQTYVIRLLCKTTILNYCGAPHVTAHAMAQCCFKLSALK